MKEGKKSFFCFFADGQQIAIDETMIHEANNIFPNLTRAIMDRSTNFDITYHGGNFMRRSSKKMGFKLELE